MIGGFSLSVKVTADPLAASTRASAPRSNKRIALTETSVTTRLRPSGDHCGELPSSVRYRTDPPETGMILIPPCCRDT